MPPITYYILDVFAKHKYEGNQLAVFIDLDNQLDGAAMLQMAKEINFAESTFVKKQLGNNKYAVKIFTTESEIPFAGHPTIGTSYIIAKHLMTEPADEIVLSLIQGDIKVTLSNPEFLEDCLFTMTQTQPEFLKTFSKMEISKGLGLDESLINTGQVIQQISTGLPFIIIPIKDLAAMEKIKLQADRFKHFLLEHKIYKSNSPQKISTSILFYTDETYEAGNDFNVRMFCLEDDLLKEDSATGSANGCFLAYRLKNKSSTVNAKVEQGFQMNRKSYLYLQGHLKEDSYDIKVGGYSRSVAQGEWG